jgi:hypothetical protein
MNKRSFKYAWVSDQPVSGGFDVLQTEHAP